MKFHHLGIVTTDSQVLLEFLLCVGYTKKADFVEIKSQSVSVCFFEKHNAPRIELVRPFESNHTLIKTLSKSIANFHLGFLVESYDESVSQLVELGFLRIGEFFSEAFNGRRCSFLFSRSGLLIELIEGV